MNWIKSPIPVCSCNEPNVKEKFSPATLSEEMTKQVVNR
jgi:hypothetical protein